MSGQFTTLYEIISYQGKKRKRKVALFVDDEKIRYGEILEKVDKLALFLTQKGIKEGDRVALFLRNSPEFIYTVFAVSKIGAIAVPINTFLKSEELDYILKDAGAKLLVASQIHEKVVNANSVCKDIIWEGDSPDTNLVTFSDAYHNTVLNDNSKTQVPRTQEDCAIIIYTSGTTGKPKGAMLSNKNLLSNMEYSKKLIEVTAKDRVIVFLPMFHTFTFTVGVAMPLYVGGSMVIIKSLQPFANVFKQTLMKRVTLFFGIP